MKTQDLYFEKLLRSSFKANCDKIIDELFKPRGGKLVFKHFSRTLLKVIF